VNGPSFDDIPPLPLTAFERSMWEDDTSEYPMSGLFELSYAGTLQRSAFETALRNALGQHPLQRSLLDLSQPRRPVWKAQPLESLPLCWACAETPREYPGGERIDLRKEIGMRVWVRQADTNGTILFQFHHATTDGIGACGFVTDVLQTYDALTDPEGNRPAPPSRNSDLLQTRGRIYPPDASWKPRLKAWLGLLDGLNPTPSGSPARRWRGRCCPS
jgi:hypothetical protein